MEALGRQVAEMQALGRPWADEGAVAAALLPAPEEAPALDARHRLGSCMACFSPAVHVQGRWMFVADWK